MNIEMVEMLIDRLGAVEDTLRVRLDKIENAIVDFRTEPRLQDLTPEKLRGTLTTRMVSASNTTYTLQTEEALCKGEIAVLKRSGFRVLKQRGPRVGTLLMIDWSPKERPTAFSGHMWEEL